VLTKATESAAELGWYSDAPKSWNAVLADAGSKERRSM
jgi:hypothetical protein